MFVVDRVALFLSLKSIFLILSRLGSFLFVLIVIIWTKQRVIEAFLLWITLGIGHIRVAYSSV
jgi:hypothetical protein